MAFFLGVNKLLSLKPYTNPAKRLGAVTLPPLTNSLSNHLFPTGTKLS
jgi:hypothetical protein